MIERNQNFPCGTESVCLNVNFAIICDIEIAKNKGGVFTPPIRNWERIMKKASAFCFTVILMCIFDTGYAKNFGDLEIYRPLSTSHVELLANGNLLVLDNHEDILYLIKKREKTKTRVAKKGQGPGELTGSRTIKIVDNRAFVLDSNGFTEFDNTGKFIKRHSLNWHHGAHIPARDGFFVFHPKKNKLFLQRTSSDKSELLFEWREQRLYPENRKPRTYYPAWESSKLLIDARSQKAFLFHAGKYLKITILDLDQGKQKEIFRKEISARPFNKDWATKEFEKRFKKRNVELATPEFFPLIKMVYFAPGERIVIELWSGSPDSRKNFQIIDFEGNEQKLRFNPKYASRLLTFDENTAYISVFNEDEEASIVSCPIEQINQVASTQPWMISKVVNDAWVAVQ